MLGLQTTKCKGFVTSQMVESNNKGGRGGGVTEDNSIIDMLKLLNNL